MASLSAQPVVLLDYGGVLAHDHLRDAEEKLASAFGVDTVRLRRALSENSLLGAQIRRSEITETEFWQQVASSLQNGVDRLPVSPHRLTRLWAETYELRSGSVEFLTSLRKFANIGIASNVDTGRLVYLRRALGAAGEFDFEFYSCELGSTKSSHSYWDSVVAQIMLRLDSPRIIYIDDRREHLHTAQAHGINGILFRDDWAVMLASVLQALSG